ncbi:hypothetical protein NBRC10512_008039 [Rhodotorula toruloides]|uniref:RHTO0S05e06898g1_1 n=2 Tax=Rhodotorula toruloides TaxID=5286 RepID=A0A061AU90_RHOTO|nr:alpha-ketoglutarate dependent taurine dioxygenase [Rhodotorula toruloides NP11]EMS23846.1 alpha-ketoglutarate dependent taurine dioxygenase [Rhodotorula toruloides NP11]CDR40748.1 RHTO0S05e06898g1_1 [Rhodotorula toruloides]
MPSVTQIEPAVASLRLNGEYDSLEVPKSTSKAGGTPYKYARFLPEWTTSLKLPPLEPFEHVDPGKRALSDPEPRSFLKTAIVKDITPEFGSEISGDIDLTKLTDRERDQLALFVAQRGVVAFRGQENFIDADYDWWVKDWTSYFGRPHIHPVSGQPKGYPELHLVWREDTGTTDERFYEGRLTTTTTHSDVSYELQPPGLTALFLFDTPASGGDTLFFDQVEAYNRLSPSFRAYLETLQVEHSGYEQASRAAALHGENTIKRQPVKNVHPLVRRHPVTGAKALYVNPGFSRRIVGLKQEESDGLLRILYDHIEKGHDFQARVRWGELGTVTLWDNRITAHSALIDWHKGMNGGRRHGARLTPQAERPFI